MGASYGQAICPNDRKTMRIPSLTPHLLSSCVLLLCWSSIWAPVNASQDIIESIQTNCENELDFDSIASFRSFLGKFKQLNIDELTSNKSLKRCLTDRQAILDLETIIVNERVCDPQNIDQLVSYHKRHFKRKHLFLGQSRPITHKFLAKYAIQVAFVCKKNMVKNLALAQDELSARKRVFEQARKSVYNGQPSLKANIKLIQEQPAEPSSSNIKPKTEAEQSLNEYREALTKIKWPEDILIFDTDECQRSRNRIVTIPRPKLDLFLKPILACHELQRYYAGSVLAVARLANLGYVARHDEIDARLADSPTIKDWVLTVQLCEPMLHTSTKEVGERTVTMDSCSDAKQIIEYMVYEDNFNELDNELLADMLPRSGSTRAHAQSVMRSAMKKMAKVDLLKQLKGHNKSIKPAASVAMLDVLSKSSLTPVARGHQNVPSRFNVAVQDDAGSPSKGLSDDEQIQLLREIVGDSGAPGANPSGQTNSDGEKAVSYVFDPISTITSFLVVMALMVSFEWLFFCVMTLAARLCHDMNFKFENLLTFPPKFLSWSDADFAYYTEKLESIDEDDFYDYDELSPEEQQQRDRLTKVFGKPPPMLYRD